MQKPIRTGPYPELTFPALIVGYLIGAIITVSIGYASLLLGFSIEGSELAAILGFGVLRGVLRRTSIIENNINQTIASSVNGASAGMMFSVPAIFILKLGDAFNPVSMVLGCVAGGILGIAFIIPLRKQMIDYERLTYPGGVAVATILKSPGAGLRKAYYLLAGAGVSAIAHLVTKLAGTSDANVGGWLGLPEYMNGVWYLSLMTVGVGYIAGRGGLYFVLGGFLCYWVLAPMMSAAGLLPSAETLGGGSLPSFLRTEHFRPVGIGMLIGGAMTGIALAFPLVLGAVRSMHKAAKVRDGVARDELPIRFLYFAIVGAFLLLLFIAMRSSPEIPLLRGAFMAVVGTIWVWVAGVVLSECIGRTNWSPLSGMTLIGITLLLAVASAGGEASDRATIVASVMVGAAMCVAMAQATDLMLDLKTGYLVGATPRLQQVGQFLGAFLGPALIMVLIFTLDKAYGLGSEQLPAPQGQVLASVIEGLLDPQKGVPVEKYAAGAGIGAVLSASGVGGLGILVGLGFYLPFKIVLTYMIGTLLRVGGDALFSRTFSERVGIPIAAGLIVGEALVGVGYAFYMIFAAAGGTG